MATRRYPNTEDQDVLAKLAGVSPEAWGRFDRITQAEKEQGGGPNFEERGHDEEADSLEDFLLFG